MYHQHFFNPRMIDISLVRGQTIYTGNGTVPTSRHGYTHQGDTQSSSESESENEHGEGTSRGQNVSKGKKSKGKKKANSGPWRLVITYKPPSRVQDDVSLVYPARRV